MIQIFLIDIKYIKYPDISIQKKHRFIFIKLKFIIHT